MMVGSRIAQSVEFLPLLSLGFALLGSWVSEVSQPFVKDGRNVMHGFVTACDEWTRPGEIVLVVNSSGKLLAIGRSQSTPKEFETFTKGIAVKVREGCP